MAEPLGTEHARRPALDVLERAGAELTCACGCVFTFETTGEDVLIPICAVYAPAGADPYLDWCKICAHNEDCHHA